MLFKSLTIRPTDGQTGLSLLLDYAYGILSNDFVHNLEEVRFTHPTFIKKGLFISEVEPQLLK